MSEAPERIWVLRNFHNQVLAVFDVDVDEPIEGRDDVEYVRADRIEELEAKLAKAIEALKFYGGVMPVAFAPYQDGGENARATLAELTGGKDE